MHPEHYYVFDKISILSPKNTTPQYSLLYDMYSFKIMYTPYMQYHISKVRHVAFSENSIIFVKV